MRAAAVYRDLLRNRALTRLLGGEFVSGIGDWLYIVALLVLVYRETHDPAILGLFSAIRMLPYIFLSIPAGVIADRFDRRLVLLVGDLIRAACMVAMGLIVAVHGPVLAVMALSIVAACGSTFFYPAIGAYIPSLVRDERQLGPANSAWATLDNLGFVLGPALGGLLLAIGGVVAAFLLNALSFVFVAAILWRLPPSRGAASHAPSGGPSADAAEQAAAAAARARDIEVRDLRRSIRPLTGVVLLQTASWVLGGAVTVLTVILAIDVLKAGEGAAGTLNAAIGVGGVSGAVIAGVLVLRRHLAFPIVAGGLALAIGFAALGIVPSLPVVFLAIAVNSAGHLVLDVLVATILQRVVHESALGRGTGIVMTVGTVGEALGALMVPAAITVFGLTATLTVFGGLALAGVLVGLLLIGAAAARAESPFEAILARVARLPLFTGVPAARLEHALGRLRARPMTAGEVVIRQGDVADLFYIVQSGEVVVSVREPDGRTHEVRRIGPDGVFGELGLLFGSPRTATVGAVTDGVLLELDGRDFLELVGGAPAIRARLIARYEPGAIAPA